LATEDDSLPPRRRDGDRLEEFSRTDEGADMGLGIPELIVILFLIILIFGASRLPEIGRGIGKGIKNFKEANRGDDR
jgi:sec-independent protein translocase protein TatA